MRVVNILMDERIFEHLACRQFDKEVSSHIVSKVGHYDGASTCFFNGTAIYLEEVQVAVYVHLAVRIIKNARSWQNLAIILCEMKQSL